MFTGKQSQSGADSQSKVVIGVRRVNNVLKSMRRISPVNRWASCSFAKQAFLSKLCPALILQKVSVQVLHPLSVWYSPSELVKLDVPKAGSAFSSPLAREAQIRGV